MQRVSVSALALILALLNVASSMSPWEKKVTCAACEVAGEGSKVLPRSWAKSAVVDIAVPICVHMNAFNNCKSDTALGEWPCKDLCQGLMGMEADVLFDLLDIHGPQAMCAGVEVCARPAPGGPQEPAAPAVKSDLSNLAGEKQWSSWTKSTGTFVHFTDLHMQLDYAPGTVGKDCGQPVCCRPEQPRVTGVEGAGLYGGDDCDMSPSVWAAMVDAIKNLDARPDFIMNTGDDPAHVIWDQSHESQERHMVNVSRTLLEAGFGDVPVVQALGNHEAEPVDQYRVPVEMDAWLYRTAMINAWGSWLTEDARRTIEAQGFFTQRLMPGLRAIVMHTTMLEDGNNWFYDADARDSQGQMLWLTDALNQSRSMGEKVYLLRHHPYGFAHVQSEMLRDITEEYGDVIVASFAGHSHTSWFTAQRDRATGTKPVSVEYIPGGSGPDHGSLNPTFRVYKYDTTTFELLDFDQYVFDYRAANADSTKAHFELSYSAKSEFGLKDLSAGEWTRLAESWLGDTEEANTTWERYCTASSRGRRSCRMNRKSEACRAMMAGSTPTPGCSSSLSYESSGLSEYPSPSGVWEFPWSDIGKMVIQAMESVLDDLNPFVTTI